MSKQASKQQPSKQQPGKRQPGKQRGQAFGKQPARRGHGRGRGGRGHIGHAGMRRSRRQRFGITAAVVGGLVVLWALVVAGSLDVGLAIGLSVLLLVALPAFVVLVLGRRY